MPAAFDFIISFFQLQSPVHVTKATPFPAPPISYTPCLCYFLIGMERGQIIQELIKAYSAELETVENYMASSVNLDGVRSDVIKNSLAADVAAELRHAEPLSHRVKTIGGTVPG